MNWEMPLLAVAIVITFLAWRRQRAQNEAMRAAAAGRLAQRTYTLEAQETAGGRGFVVRDAAERELARAQLDWQEHGLEVVTVHSAALELVPGVALLLEPAGDAVDVLLEESAQSCGVLRGADAASVLQKLAADEIGSALVLWEQRAGDRVPELSILLVHSDVAMDTME